MISLQGCKRDVCNQEPADSHILLPLTATVQNCAPGRNKQGIGRCKHYRMVEARGDPLKSWVPAETPRADFPDSFGMSPLPLCATCASAELPSVKRCFQIFRWSLFHQLTDPSLDSLQYAHVCLVLESPDLGMGLQVWFDKCQENHQPSLLQGHNIGFWSAGCPPALPGCS